MVNLNFKGCSEKHTTVLYSSLNGRVINQKSKMMFREVLQSGVFKLISSLYLGLKDESDFSLQSFFSFFFTCLLSLVYEVECRAVKRFYFIFFLTTYMSIIIPI